MATSRGIKAKESKEGHERSSWYSITPTTPKLEGILSTLLSTLNGPLNML